MAVKTYDRDLIDVSQIAATIRDNLFAPVRSKKKTVFICGAGKEKRDSVRSAIGREFTSQKYSYRYDVLYPEELFGELLYGEHRCDLLQLETILAQSVYALLLIPESTGAIAELGAFTASTSLLSKIVCLQDIKYKRKPSFINYGPIRLIRDSKKGKVLYVDYTRIRDEMDKIRRAISEIPFESNVAPRVDNIVHATTFLLLAIYLLEPIDQNILFRLISLASGGNSLTCRAVTSGALSLLRKRKWSTRRPDGYALTQMGIAAMMELGRHGKTHSYFDIDIMDSIRVDILSWRYRGKPLMNIY